MAQNNQPTDEEMVEVQPGDVRDEAEDRVADAREGGEAIVDDPDEENEAKE